MEPERIVRFGVDTAAGLTAWAAFLDLVPKIAALLSVVWLSIQIGEWLWKKLTARQ